MFQEALAAKYKMHKRFKLEALNREAKGTRVTLQEIKDKKEEFEEIYSDIEESCEIAELPKFKLSIVPSSEISRSYFRKSRARDSSSSISTVHCLPKASDKMMEYRRNANRQDLYSRKEELKSVLVSTVKKTNIPV